MGYSHVGSQTLTRALRLSLILGFSDVGSTCSPSNIMLCNRGGLSSLIKLVSNQPLGSFAARCKHRIVGCVVMHDGPGYSRRLVC